MEAQHFPDDFDGIAAGAPVMLYQELNAAHSWLLQRVFRDALPATLHTTRQQRRNRRTLTKLKILNDAVLRAVRRQDRISDGVVDSPLACGSDPARDFADKVCASGVDGDDCFTPAQLQTIKDFYSRPYDSAGASVLKGRALGSELGSTF